MVLTMQIDKLPPPHLHLCLSCQEPYTIYYNDTKEPDMMYVCHCGVERAFGNFKKIKAAKIDKEIEEWAGKVREAMTPFIKPILDRCIELLAMQGIVTDEEIEKIANEEIEKRNAELTSLNKTVTTESKEKPDKV